MSLTRKYVRQFIVDLLKRKKTAAGDNVFGNRSLNVWQKDLPAIMIYPRSESIIKVAESPKQLQRNSKLSVEMVVNGEDDIEAADKLENLMHEVERILAVDDSLGDLVSELVITDVEFDFEELSEQPIASGRLIYSLEYYECSPEDRKDQPTFDLASINAKWDINTANDPDPEAEDNIDLPQ